MRLQKPNLKRGSEALLALSIAQTAIVAGPVSAQDLDEAARGNLTCAAPLPIYHVPGLDGLPLWPADETKQANTEIDGGVPPADEKARERSLISDPRWGNAPLIPLKHVAGQAAEGNTDNVRFRILKDSSDPANPRLAVSIQIFDDANGATVDDYVMFGLATDDGQSAYGLKYTPVKIVNDAPAKGSYLKATVAPGSGPQLDTDWWSVARRRWRGRLSALDRPEPSCVLEQCQRRTEARQRRGMGRAVQGQRTRCAAHRKTSRLRRRACGQRRQRCIRLRQRQHFHWMCRRDLQDGSHQHRHRGLSGQCRHLDAALCTYAAL